MKFAIIIVFFALFVWLGNLKILSLARDWPLLLIFLGLINLFSLPKYSKKKIIDDLENGKITPEEALRRLERLH